MRSYTTYLSGYPLEVLYPDEVAFAFNPLLCQINTSGPTTKLEFAVSDGATKRSIEVVTVSGSGATISFERIVQLFFDDVLFIRSKSISISLLHDGVSIFSQSLLAVWGGLSIGERFSCYGEYNDDGKGWVRHAVWFKNFPFTVSLFSQSHTPNLWGYNAGVFGVPFTYVNGVIGYGECGNYEPFGIFEMIPEQDYPYETSLLMYGTGALQSHNVFDPSFDYTFGGNASMAQCVKVQVRNERDGFYLRWIDRHGFIQYYLFSKGQESIKNKLSADTINLDNCLVGTMHFPNTVRQTHVEGENTCKCCAVSLPDEIYEFVSTITTSPVIDLYFGVSKRGERIWIPINIVSASHSYNHKEELHDLEITFRKPDTNAQSL